MLLKAHIAYLQYYIQYEWLKKYKISTLIDVGAYKGHVGQAIKAIEPQAKIFAFEPIPKYYHYLKKAKFAKDWAVEEIAIDNTSGYKTFYTNEYSPGSSLLKVSKKGKTRYPFLSESTGHKVRTSTLDGYFENIKLKGTVILKIDTQGTEYNILKSGEKTLKKIDIIHIEIGFDQLYENQACFEDIYKLLTNRGFTYKGVLLDSEFYPIFGPQRQQNFLFANSRKSAP